MSPEALRLLRFAIRYKGWHSFDNGQQRKTRRALLRLEELELIEIARHARPATDQFRLAWQE